MNIFITDSSPILAAKSLCGRHIVKMPSETKQMISLAFDDSIKAYRNHPASIWCRKTKENLEWTVLHGLAQCEEYTRRYKRRHASQDFIEWSSNNYQNLSFPETGLTQFARCFGPFKSELDSEEPDTLQAYRKFYYLDKKDFAKWPSKKEIPEWWPEISEKYVDKAFVNGVYSRR